MEPIAVVRLASGEVGYYDPLSRIHLTISNPSTPIRPGTNVTQIQKSVKFGRLLLIAGSLEVKKVEQIVNTSVREEKITRIVPEIKSVPAPTPVIKEGPAVEVTVVVEQPVVEIAPVVEFPVEELIPAIVEEQVEVPVVEEIEIQATEKTEESTEQSFKNGRRRNR